MSKNKIKISDQFHLSQVTENDIHALVKYIGEKEVSGNLLLVPHPYELSDAHWWIEHVEKTKQEHNRLTNWSIRTTAGDLIGGIGCQLKYGPDSHKDEIGYWLGKPFWGQGIMPVVVQEYCKHLFDNIGLIRIEATIFYRNSGSERVLQKCGFELEGINKKAYKKAEGYLDGKMYALVK
jgi:ribosomal-protein-alanine N-acetyltransferase